IFFFIKAHLNSDFSEERRKPNSLIYYQDADTDTSLWLTYDKEIDEWTETYLGKNPEKASKYLENTSYSKYGIHFSFAAEASKMAIPEFELILDSDSVMDNLRNIQFTMVPRRKVNRIELYNNEDISFNSLEFNG